LLNIYAVVNKTLCNNYYLRNNYYHCNMHITNDTMQNVPVTCYCLPIANGFMAYISILTYTLKNNSLWMRY